jgi:hypothetical protein
MARHGTRSGTFVFPRNAWMKPSEGPWSEDFTLQGTDGKLNILAVDPEVLVSPDRDRRQEYCRLLAAGVARVAL